MAKHRTHSVEFKRHVSQEYVGGETLHGLRPTRAQSPLGSTSHCSRGPDTLPSAIRSYSPPDSYPRIAAVAGALRLGRHLRNVSLAGCASRSALVPPWQHIVARVLAFEIDAIPEPSACHSIQVVPKQGSVGQRAHFRRPRLPARDHLQCRHNMDETPLHPPSAAGHQISPCCSHDTQGQDSRELPRALDSGFLEGSDREWTQYAVRIEDIGHISVRRVARHR